MRKVLTLAVLMAVAVGAVSQELPTAEEIVQHLVDIMRNPGANSYGVAYLLYTSELADLFEIDAEIADAPLPPSNSSWRVSSNIDPLTDEIRWILQSVAIEGRSVYGDRPVLVLRWQAGRTEMYIRWDSYISDGDRTVRWRIGDAQAVNERLSLSTDNQAPFFPSRSAVGMIQRLMDADRFVAQITPYNASPITAVFNIAGLRAEVQSRPDLAEWLESLDEEPEAPTATGRENLVKPLRVPGN